MNIRHSLSAILILFLGLIVFNTDDQIPNTFQWLSFEQADALHKDEPKKILIDIYTDWCGWCKKMDKFTYTDPGIIRQLNEDYYVVKFNAESKDSVRFNNRTFYFKPEYKAHELAVGLLQGRMSYPSTIFLDENLNVLTVVPGYLTPDNLAPILTYFGDDHYKTKKWEEFEKQYKKN